MLILVTYDVDTTTKAGQKRLRLVAKECLNYGQRVQNSVFECVVDNTQFTQLKIHLKSIVDELSDSIRFYQIGKNYEQKIETIGKNNAVRLNIDQDLIL